MIIYSTRLWLRCGFDAAWDIASRWTAYKFKVDATSMGFDRDNLRQSGRMRAEWLISRDSTLSLASCRVTHPDSTIEGRTWITDLGVRDSEGKPGLIECSVTLRTIDASTMVASRPQTTRPLVVKHWLDEGDPAEITAGYQINTLHRDNAAPFLAWIETKQREQPILLLSPQMTGAMIVQPENAWLMLGGLSDVVRVQHGHVEDVKRVLGERYAAWNGAARVIYPPTYRDGRRFIHVERLTADDLMLMSAQEDGKQGRDLLEVISHRVNSANAWNQLALEGVRDRRVRQEILRRQADSEAADLLLAEAAEQEAKLNQLKSDLAERGQEISDLNDQLRRSRAEVESWRTSMDFQRAEQGKGDTRLTELRPYFINAVEDDASLEEILRLIEAFFPERVVILSNAYDSARESAAFEYRETAFKLILKLVTLYWEALVSGGGDAKARTVFGKEEYSAQESETVEKNQRARRLRTFTYKGEEVEMTRHLKHGVKDTVADTLRLHFHWDGQAKKIVIGHCGKHLDFS